MLAAAAAGQIGTTRSAISKLERRWATITREIGRRPIASLIARSGHPAGIEALYVNGGHTVRFKDMTEEDSAPLLQYLFWHQQRPEFTCRFRWEVGSIAFWDNRCTQHNPINDYHGFRRIMHRVTLAGDHLR